MVSFLSGMMDLGIGWLELHETISKEVIRSIIIDLGWQPQWTHPLKKMYYELVGHSDGTFTNIPREGFNL